MKIYLVDEKKPYKHEFSEFLYTVKAWEIWLSAVTYHFLTFFLLTKTSQKFQNSISDNLLVSSPKVPASSINLSNYLGLLMYNLIFLVIMVFFARAWDKKYSAWGLLVVGIFVSFIFELAVGFV